MYINERKKEDEINGGDASLQGFRVVADSVDDFIAGMTLLLLLSSHFVVF